MHCENFMVSGGIIEKWNIAVAVIGHIGVTKGEGVPDR